jgi:HEAT repeat protein
MDSGTWRRVGGMVTEMRFTASSFDNPLMKFPLPPELGEESMPGPISKTFQMLATTANPFAGELLVEALDVPVPAIQSQALESILGRGGSGQAVDRQELQGFDLGCLLSRFEEMSALARANAGQLLQKIDPDCLSKLAQEFHHPIRRRRIRAIRGALAFGWQEQVVPPLLEMLQDEDALIRRTAIEVLANIPTPEVIVSLIVLKNDPSDRVRDALDQALAALATKEAIHPPLETQPAR